MTELAGEPIRAKLTAAPGNGLPFGGIKVIAENGWFAARPSGTEDVYKIYAESFRCEGHLRQIQQEAQNTSLRVREGKRQLRKIVRGSSRDSSGPAHRAKRPSFTPKPLVYLCRSQPCRVARQEPGALHRR
jgi:hypothetical protein